MRRLSQPWVKYRVCSSPQAMARAALWWQRSIVLLATGIASLPGCPGCWESSFSAVGGCRQRRGLTSQGEGRCVISAPKRMASVMAFFDSWKVLTMRIYGLGQGMAWIASLCHAVERNLPSVSWSQTSCGWLLHMSVVGSLWWHRGTLEAIKWWSLWPFVGVQHNACLASACKMIRGVPPVLLKVWVVMDGVNDTALLTFDRTAWNHDCNHLPIRGSLEVLLCTAIGQTVWCNLLSGDGLVQWDAMITILGIRNCLPGILRDATCEMKGEVHCKCLSFAGE